MLFIQNEAECLKKEFVSKLGTVDTVTRLMLLIVCTHVHKNPSTIHLAWWNMSDLWNHQRSRHSLLNDMDQGNKRMAVVVGDNSGNRRGTKTFRSPWALSSLAGRFHPKLCSQTPSLDPFWQTQGIWLLSTSSPAVFLRAGDSPLAFLHADSILSRPPGSVSLWNPWVWVSCLPLTWFQNAFEKAKEQTLAGKKALEQTPPLNPLSPLPCTTNHQNSPHQHREHLRPPRRIDNLTTRCHE